VAGARSLCPGTVWSLGYKKYSTVATTRNRATGIAKVMTETDLIFWAARCHRQQSGHSMTKLSSSEEFHG
jgi:hypothetical protein